MELYTVQLAKWKTLEGTDIEVVNTTVKNGLEVFAPTWDLVLGYKSGKYSEAYYREHYINKMRESYYANRDLWISYLQKDKIALSCMCPAGNFCHRLILKEIFMGLGANLGLPVTDQGEFGHVGT